MWNVLSFTLAKAGTGRACSPVIIYIAFTYLITLLFLKWTTIVSIIHIGVQGPKTVCVHIVSALPAIFAPLVAATENRDFSLP